MGKIEVLKSKDDLKKLNSIIKERENKNKNKLNNSILNIVSKLKNDINNSQEVTKEHLLRTIDLIVQLTNSKKV